MTIYDDLVEMAKKHGIDPVRRACKRFLSKRDPIAIKTPRKAISKSTRKIVFDRFDGICQRRKHRIFFSQATVDHIIPLALGGQDSEENYTLLCKSCNSSKGDNSLLEESKKTGKLFTEILGDNDGQSSDES